MPEEQLFSEEEATQVLKKAAMLHEQANSNWPSYKPGITEAELKKMAEDMGIDVAFLREAIEQHNIATEEPASRLSFSEQANYVFDGELNPDRYDIITEVVGPQLSRRGQYGLQQVGRSVAGQIMCGANSMQVQVTSRNGRTRLITRSVPVLGIVFGAQVAFMTTIFTLAATTETGNPIAAVIGIPLGLLAGYGLFRTLANNGRKKSREMVEKLRNAISQELKSQKENPES